MKRLTSLLFIALIFSCAKPTDPDSQILPGAYQLEEYLPLLEEKRVGLFVNHTSLIKEAHLIDTLQLLNVNITKVFSPEHGFKGKHSDGEEIENQVNENDFELISLYGSSKKPSDDQMSDLDVLIIDIQDVGVRFYTYASTMTYLMESCARNGVKVILLDRPNPNGSYVDGPVLKEEFSSFIGLHPIPLVHGLTLGELALMINGEGWLENETQCDLKIIKVRNWTHDMPYSLPINPSPNLPNDLSISLYPSLGLFEGTVASVGRGTKKQFQIIGHPAYPDTAFSFIPKPNLGSKYPPLEGKTCYGVDLSGKTIKYELDLKFLIEFYSSTKGSLENSFFNSYFKKLAGTDELQKQIETGVSEEMIRKSWESDLGSYRKMRQEYLLYPEKR
ncbi:MAG: DUF1343 domain-containing protein [Cyclobacteriaceae bacterium]